MKYKIIQVLAILLVFMLSIQIATALIDVYTGDIHMQSISTLIDIQENATINVQYVMINSVPEERHVILDFYLDDAVVEMNGGPLVNPVVFQPNESIGFNVTYESEVIGDSSRSISFRPTVLFNGKYHSKQTEIYDIKAILPDSVNKLLVSSKPFTSTATENERTAYFWHLENQYPTTLYLKWSTLNYDLTLTKNATHITVFNQTIYITVRIQNNGANQVENITLIDKFPIGILEPVSPLEDFITINPDSPDRGIIWNKIISSLGPGEMREFSYSMRPIQMKNILLAPTVAFLNPSPVAFSNRVTIENRLCGNGICDPNENYLNCIEECPLTDDYDEDGINNSLDNCPYYNNPGQNDTDGDGAGDICDPLPADSDNDVDNDGYDIFITGDNCPTIFNPDQNDTDSDGYGDVCDNCPDGYDPDQSDSDSDGYGDVCDNCPDIPNSGQADADGNGIGDICDCYGYELTVFYQDADGDGYGNPSVSKEACTVLEDYVEDNSDCNDANSTVNPEAIEVCDNLDNDCDGLKNEGLGTTSCGLGVCEHTIDNCVNGKWQTCDPVEGASDEICDGLDNDCDGMTDEGLTPPPADNQYGVCEGLVKVCDGINGWTEPDYSSLPDYEDPEVSCDYLDNDCDNEVDEDCVEINVNFTEKSKTESLWHGHFVTNPVPGQAVVAYEKACAEMQVGNWSEFTKHAYSDKQSEMQSIEDNCGLLAGCLTGEDGQCRLNVPEGQDYIVFSEFESWSCQAKLVNRPKFSNWSEMIEWLRTSCREAGELHYAIYKYAVTAEPGASVILAVYKTKWGAYHPIKHLGTIFGSVLDASATEYMVRVPDGESFDSELDPGGEVRYVYPIVLESNAEWEVAINTSPPEGYERVTPTEQIEISPGNPQLAVIAYKPIIEED